MMRPRATSSIRGTATNSASRPDITRAAAGFGCARLSSRSVTERFMSMFESDRSDERRNDQYGWIDSIAPDLLRASRELVEKGEASRVSDERVAQTPTTAIRFYPPKSN